MKKNKPRFESADDFFKKLLKNPEIRMRYEKERIKTEVAMAVLAARKKADLTQAKLAEKAGTSQTVIARLESGADSRTPSMPLLASIAEACGAHFEFGFKFKAPLHKVNAHSRV